MDDLPFRRGDTFLRFLVAGVINTLFGFAAYSTSILAGAKPWLALLVGMLAGTVFNFFTTGGYPFRQFSIRRWPKFVTAHLGTYLVNLSLVNGLSGVVASDVIAQALLLAPMAVLSYFLMARFVFAPDD